jgi:hypothetical protein
MARLPVRDSMIRLGEVILLIRFLSVSCCRQRIEVCLCIAEVTLGEAMHRERRFRIVDPERLAKEIKLALDTRYGGSQSEAARDVGLSQSQLSRLLSCQMRLVTRTTLEALLTLVEEWRHSGLYQAFLTPLEWGALRRYYEWTDMWDGDTQPIEYEFPPSREADEGVAQRRERWMDLVEDLRKRFPAHFNDFDRFLKSRGHRGIRVDLAFRRIVEPLLQTDGSGGIERDWRELNHEELEAFVKAGIKRETIMLDRSPDIQRAKEASERVSQPQDRQTP